MDITLLKKLGLNGYESQAYLILVKHKTLTAKDVAKKSGVPPTAIYPNLKSLVNKKLISEITKEPLTYNVIDPGIGLKSFKYKKKKELDSAQEEILKNLDRVRTEKPTRIEEDFLDILKGWKQSAELVKKLIINSKKEFLLMSGVTEKTALIIVHELKKALKRGVSVKFIIVEKPEKNKEILASLSKLGVKMKYFPVKNFALEIKDSEESVIVLRNSKIKDRLVLHMKNKDLARAHRDYFYSVWKRAKKYELVKI